MAKVALLKTDEFGLVSWANQAACDLLDRQEYQIIGHFIFSWLTVESARLATIVWDESISKSRPIECAVQAISLEGKVFSLSLYGEVPEEGGQRSSFVVVSLGSLSTSGGINVELTVTNQVVSELLRKQDALSLQFNASQQKARYLEYEVQRLHAWLPTQSANFSLREAQLKESIARGVRLEKLLVAATTENKKSTEESALLRSELAARNSHVASLSEKITLLAEELQKKSTLIGESERRVEINSVELAAHVATINQLEEQISELEKIIVEQNVRSKQLESHITSLGVHQRSLETMTADFNSLKTTHALLSSELSGTRETIRSQIKELAVLKAQSIQHQRTHSKVNEVLAAQVLVEMENQSLRSSARQAEQRITELEPKLRTLEKSLSEQQSALNALLQETKERASALKLAQREISLLTDRLAGAELEMQERMRQVFQQEKPSPTARERVATIDSEQFQPPYLLTSAAAQRVPTNQLVDEETESFLRLDYHLQGNSDSLPVKAHASEAPSAWNSAAAPTDREEANLLNEILSGRSEESTQREDSFSLATTADTTDGEQYTEELPPELLNSPISVEPEERSRVLLVEDSTMNQREISSLLRVLKISVSLAENGKEALQLLENHRFDFVLMDGNMPVMDGFESSKAIRQVEKRIARHTPIIGMLVDLDPREIQRCRNAGMDEAVAKPISIETLEKLISSYCNHH